MATSTDDNAADGKIGSAVLLIMSRTAQTLIFVLYKLSAYFKIVQYQRHRIINANFTTIYT